MAYLDDFLASARRRVEDLRAHVTPEALEQRIAAMEPPRGFAAALQGAEVAIIAEIKRRSPAKGDLDLDLNAREVARAYAEGGAAALSVLTDTEFFRGTMDDLVQARAAGLPVLRKDFVVDELQVLESRAWGADAVLLIVRALGPELDGLVSACSALGIDALVEVHDDDDLERALDASASLVGVNHRDLQSFDVDPERTAKLAPRVPEHVTLVALSGVTTRKEVQRLGSLGARAVLVGETLVTADDPAAKLRRLRAPE